MLYHDDVMILLAAMLAALAHYTTTHVSIWRAWKPGFLHSGSGRKPTQKLLRIESSAKWEKVAFWRGEPFEHDFSVMKINSFVARAKCSTKPRKSNTEATKTNDRQWKPTADSESAWKTVLHRHIFNRFLWSLKFFVNFWGVHFRARQIDIWYICYYT